MVTIALCVSGFECRSLRLAVVCSDTMVSFVQIGHNIVMQRIGCLEVVPQLQSGDPRVHVSPTQRLGAVPVFTTTAPNTTVSATIARPVALTLHLLHLNLHALVCILHCPGGRQPAVMRGATCYNASTALMNPLLDTQRPAALPRCDESGHNNNDDQQDAYKYRRERRNALNSDRVSTWQL